MNHLDSAKETLNLYAQQIITLNHRLSEEFNEVVNMILACQGRVVVGGIGKSGLVGKKMVATFASTGTPSFFLHPTEAFHGDLGMLKPIDMVILISNSGETDDVNKLIPSLKNFGNKIIAMTGNPYSTLGRNADVILNIGVEREACLNNLAPTSSTLVTMALGDALAIALMKARDFRPEDFARYHPGGSLGRKLLNRVRDVMVRKVPTASLDTTFTECLSVMNEGRMGVAVIMQDDKLEGIITDGDIRRTLAKFGAESLNKTADEIMTRNPKTINDTEFLAKAEDLMKELKIHSLIAVNDEGKVTGLMEFSS
ncbi:TPA: KpsF/GutQ family sugar-phosphate isomerase [Mannheimia haemolytica]|uniref:Arabinose 5-phosphate isomerase n=2 Tax=Mannheimia haemolytica TaxID=75985 RepID=A0A249A4K0_MANHA|nr:KpsF/GutQ family sugar-phosphate isomerase [Mannheimia haemolytica]AWW72622.1 KpsF/GutQ family sugar-phosphate isomerase [Pasteurellaceae bacterium 12565]AGI33959.1 KpsF/GutQ family sugar-phosphate isomerase [Mannheimia haemolytica USDA-ARS-USMARC-183]AGI34129.1 KpsF/GutQ family sugar-phosphate isomerase [Mannheimia haemolytica USDA-ARS-USMARC-185]AGK01130.1 D-arabinose 5-phosphate isomerase GutQ [Mannheimia haemolytica M42548]AGQ25811.1 arabinose 5-phosphate isomerase [Mannheimia haemolyti